MKQLLSLLLLSTVLCSCGKDDDPIQEQQVKVIDKIEIKRTIVSTGSTSINSILFEYNTNKEISKIDKFNENTLHYSYTYVYQNNVPVSSMYDFPNGGDPVYEVKYGYTDGKFSSYYDSYYRSTVSFSYNEIYNQYTNTESNGQFILNENNDVSIKKTASVNNEFSYTFDTAKKGPLFNVVNKKWFPALVFGCFSDETVNTVTTYPVTSLFDDNLAQTNPYSNTYDTDGFIIKSVFTTNNGNVAYEVTYNYKSI